MPVEKTLFHEKHMHVKRCRHGPMLYNVTDPHVGRSLDLYGEYSELESALFTLVLKPGMVAIDAGANIGCFTVIMAKKVGPDGLIFAIEAQRSIFQTLCANVALNMLPNVETIYAAAGAEAGNIVVPQINYFDDGYFGDVELGEYKEGETVPIAVIDALPLTACHLIKIDVEGMEGAAIEGAKETIAKFRPVLYVENDRKDKSKALIEQIMAADYRLFLHRPPLFNPDNFFGNPENVFGGMGSFNMICIPKSHDYQLDNLIEITSSDERHD